MKLSLATLCLSLLLSMPAGAKLDVGVTPPDLLGNTPKRDEIRISQFKGTVVVVTFWASWCGPCRRELPVLDALQKAAGNKVRIIAVNVEDTPEDYRIMRKQMKDSALTFTHDRRGIIAKGFAVNSYPNLYVIDQAGTISAVHVGFDANSLLEIVDDINRLLVSPPRASAPGAGKA